MAHRFVRATDLRNGRARYPDRLRSDQAPHRSSQTIRRIAKLRAIDRITASAFQARVQALFGSEPRKSAHDQSVERAVSAVESVPTASTWIACGISHRSIALDNVEATTLQLTRLRTTCSMSHSALRRIVG